MKTAACYVVPMPVWLSDDEYRILESVCARLVPAVDGRPGALEVGAADYVDRLLGAFEFDPPLVWAGGPTSGRMGGDPHFGSFHRLSALDELAWRTRIEGSQGIAEREFNGPVVGLQQRYREGLAELGTGFCDLDPPDQDERLGELPALVELVYGHVCEGMYGAPEYGGNRHGAAWASIGFAGDVQPRGWTDAEVSEP